VSLAGEELIIDGQAIDANIAGSITAATLVRRIDGATRLNLTVFDPRMELLAGKLKPDGTREPAALTRPGKPSKGQKQFAEAAWDRFSAMRLTFDGISFRLAGGGFRYNPTTYEVTLSFEDELAVLMRGQHAAVKVSRGQDTRAEFNRTLVRRTLARADVRFSRAINDRYFSPQAGQRETIKEPDEDGRTKGFAKGKRFKIKTEYADSEQKAVLTTALTEADRLRSGERATLADIVAMITESECRNLTGGDADSSGPLQVQQRTATGITPRTVIDPRSGNVHGSVTPRTITPGALNPRDVTEVTRLFMLRGFAADASGAIRYAADHPDAEIYEIAQAMQGSGAGASSNGQANYGPWVEQAKAILDAWGGAGTLHTIREAYEFRAGGRHNGTLSNYWDDSGDSAEEVHWRRFCDRNRQWFVPDEWLFARKPTIYITGENGPEGLAGQGIIDIDTSGFDVGLPTADILIRVFLPRWGGAPGAVAEFEHLGALDGDWLIAYNDMDLLQPTELATLTLQRPRPKKKEPAPKTNTVQLTETKPEAGSVRESIVAAAKKANKQRNNYYYLQHRPMHGGLFENDITGAGPVQPMGIDCSEFATLVYKTAGAPDPNGSGYNGSGNTDTLMANGKKTSDPQPGDLVFYRNPDHVGVYIGAGEEIEMGSNPGPLKLKVQGYRDADRLGYWTFDLGSGQ
jgi:cell wall-associated NlpC family hydrolase